MISEIRQTRDFVMILKLPKTRCCGIKLEVVKSLGFVMIFEFRQILGFAWIFESRQTLVQTYFLQTLGRLKINFGGKRVRGKFSS